MQDWLTRVGRKACDAIFVDGQQRTIIIEVKNYMGKTQAVGQLLSDRALVRQQLDQLEAIAVARVLLQESDLFLPTLALVQRLIREREATHDRIMCLRRLLRALDAVIHLAIRCSRCWAAQTHVFLLERAWFLYHGDRPPRITPAVVGVLNGLGRTRSMPITA